MQVMQVLEVTGNSVAVVQVISSILEIPLFRETLVTSCVQMLNTHYMALLFSDSFVQITKALMKHTKGKM
jgi:hypothetical protein